MKEIAMTTTATTDMATATARAAEETTAMAVENQEGKKDTQSVEQ